jgi:hypothetical protein
MALMARAAACALPVRRLVAAIRPAIVVAVGAAAVAMLTLLAMLTVLTVLAVTGLARLVLGMTALAVLAVLAMALRLRSLLGGGGGGDHERDRGKYRLHCLSPLESMSGMASILRGVVEGAGPPPSGCR